MKKWEVRISATYEVEAKDEDEAIENAIAEISDLDCTATDLGDDDEDEDEDEEEEETE